MALAYPIGMAQVRFDSPQPLRASRTDAGLLRAPARLTRTGIFAYQRADGSAWLEYRSPAAVFNPASLATLRGVPVTVGHPGNVDGANWGAHAKGDVRDDVRQDGDYVAATVAVNDGPTIADVDGGNLTELSCGYTADIVAEAGVTPEGERYDARQENIRYNHLALLPKNGGRAGANVRLIMDGKDTELMPVNEIVKADAAMRYPYPMDEIAKAVEAKLKAEAKADAAEALLSEAAAKLDKVRADSAEALAKAQAELSTFDARVDARVALVATAKALAPAFDIAGKSDTDIKRAVAASANPALKLDGKDASYVEVLFDMAIARAAEVKADAVKADASRTDAAAAAVSAVVPATDPVAAAKARMDARNKALAGGSDK